jgi:Acetyltransferases
MRSTNRTRPLPNYHRIWQEAFDEHDEAYIDLFCTQALPLARVLYKGPPKNPHAALCLLPLSLHRPGNPPIPGYYLYALGTLKAFRGQGLGKQLLEEARSLALQNGQKFILLQPTQPGLFGYYAPLGYTHTLYRAQTTLLTPLSTPFLPSEAQIQHLIQLSAPTPQSPLFSRFCHSPQGLAYAQAECRIRGGHIIDSAFCYPALDPLNGENYIEVKYFEADDLSQLSTLLAAICNTFPQTRRFRFYGKPQPPQDTAPGLEQTPFAQLQTLDPSIQPPDYSGFFALGLD